MNKIVYCALPMVFAIFGTAITPATAAIPPDQIGWSGVYTNVKVELTDLDLTDNLTPQVTVSDREFVSFFESELTNLQGVNAITGFLGPKTGLLLSYSAEITLQALDRQDSFANLLYLELGFMGGGQGYVNGEYLEGYLSSDIKPFTQYTGKPITKTFSFEESVAFYNASDAERPTFEQFSFSLGEIIFFGEKGSPVAAIPEPSTYVLMLMGLGLVGFIARQRKTV